MSICSINATIDRITVAEENSPIAVFKCKSVNKFDSMFANTIITKKMIENNHEDFIGVYHKNMDIVDIRKTLKNIHTVSTPSINEFKHTLSLDTTSKNEEVKVEVPKVKKVKNKKSKKLNNIQLSEDAYLV